MSAPLVCFGEKMQKMKFLQKIRGIPFITFYAVRGTFCVAFVNISGCLPIYKQEYRGEMPNDGSRYM